MQAISEMSVSAALVFALDAKGRPEPVLRAPFILPPASQIGPITAQERQAALAASLAAGVHKKKIDRGSAYDVFKGRSATRAPVKMIARCQNHQRRHLGRPRDLLSAIGYRTRSATYWTAAAGVRTGESTPLSIRRRVV